MTTAEEERWRIYGYVLISYSGFVLLQAAVFLGYECYKACIPNRKPFKSVATKLNILVIVQFISIGLWALARGLYYVAASFGGGYSSLFSDAIAVFLPILQFASIDTFRQAYIAYLWMKSGKIIELNSPGSFNIFKWVIFFSPIVCYCTTLARIALGTSIANPIEIGTTAIILSIDLFFTFNFLKFTRESRKNLNAGKSNTGFDIIAKYGIRSTCCVYLGYVFFMLPLDGLSRILLTVFVNAAIYNMIKMKWETSRDRVKNPSTTVSNASPVSNKASSTARIE